MGLFYRQRDSDLIVEGLLNNKSSLTVELIIKRIDGLPFMKVFE